MEETIPTNKESKVNLIFLTILVLGVGLLGGWYYGQSLGYDQGYSEGYDKGKEEGITQGREDLLAEQEQTVQEVIDELQAAANPYEEATGTNPFSEDYVNPFSE